MGNACYGGVSHGRDEDLMFECEELGDDECGSGS